VSVIRDVVQAVFGVSAEPPPLALAKKDNLVGYQSVEQSRGWFPLVQEAFSGAWQRNMVLSTENVLTYAAVYACVTLKASDIAKLRVKLVEQDRNGFWHETNNAAYSPVLRKPNHFQTWLQFMEQWMVSKFVHGNTYILKVRNDRGGVGRGNVTGIYVLDPRRVRVQVAPDGGVYYALSVDTLAFVEQAITVPASEIIHDVMVPLYHPLCGVSAITACGLAAMQGLRVQNHSQKFFAQGSVPSGVITMPDEIDDEQARDIQQRWQDQFSGNNAGRVAVLGAKMTYQQMMMSAVDAQLIDQLKWTSENVCTAHHVPPYMIGVGPVPSFNNVEALNQQYYAQALQNPIEAAEALLDEGLELTTGLGTEFDIDNLLRMDTVSRNESASKAIKAGMSPDEVRAKFHDLPPVPGGKSVYMQQQDFSLEALAKRDAKEDPFAKSGDTSTATPTAQADQTPGDATPAPAPPPAPKSRAGEVLRLKAAALTLRREYEHV
jgi:HK97 family phage portal protein